MCEPLYLTYLDTMSIVSRARARHNPWCGDALPWGLHLIHQIPHFKPFSWMQKRNYHYRDPDVREIWGYCLCVVSEKRHLINRI